MTRCKFLVIAIFALAIFSLPSLAEAKTADQSDAPIPGLIAMDSNALNNYAGGQSVTNNTTTVTSNATANADSTSNTITGNVATGNIANINVLGNSGLTSTITNTGNMVSISQATSITVTLH